MAQELGENVNIQSCLNNTSNWRGRAQQIIGLQLKVGLYTCNSDHVISELCYIGTILQRNYMKIGSHNMAVISKFLKASCVEKGIGLDKQNF